MLSKKFVNDERAISNLIATLILIAVAVVGGAFAYTAFRNQATSTTTSASLQVQDLNAQKVSDNLYVSATLKNDGSQRLSSIAVKINPGGANTVTLNPMNDAGNNEADPGVTVSASKTKGDILNAGETYAVRITASTPDGSITKTTTVRVES